VTGSVQKDDGPLKVFYNFVGRVSEIGDRITSEGYEREATDAASVRSMSTRIFPAVPTLTDGAANGIIYATLGLVLILTIGFFLQSRENRKNATDKVLERAHALQRETQSRP
jgi:hypothetical protein